MGDNRQEPEQEEDVPEPQPRRRGRQEPSEAPDVGAQVRSILSEMARSGELLGGGGDDGEEPGQGGRTSSPPSFDLKGAIREVLAEREQEGEAERERKTVHDRLDRLENPPRKKQWGKPWSPFGG